MNAAPFRITLGVDGKRPRRLSRIIESDTLDGAVLCAAQWLVWSNSAGRGKRDKYSWYRIEHRVGGAVWGDATSGTLAEARQYWTAEDEARIEAQPEPQPLLMVTGTTKHGKARVRRTPGAPKSRLAQLVSKVLADRQ